MRLSSKGIVMTMAAGAFFLASCSHETDFYNPGNENQKTDENFKGLVGDIDPAHTWETVANAEVSLPVSYGTGDKFNVTYMANERIVGTATVNDGETLRGKVAVPSYTTELQVQLTTAKGLSTIITVPAKLTRAAGTRSGEAYTVKPAVEYGNALAYTRVYPGENEQSNWGNFYNPYATGSKTPYVWPHKFYYVENALNGIKVDFTEGFVDKVNEVFGGDNSLPEETRGIIVQDYGLTTAQEGPVKLRYVTGASENRAAIGYFIYKDNPDEIENMDVSEQAIHDILFETQQDKLSWSGTSYWANEGTVDENPTATLSDLKTCNKYVIIDDIKNAGLESGDEIQLTYYDEQGNPSAYFPAGTKIGFFIVPTNGVVADHTTGVIDTRNAVYSFSKMNVEPHQCTNYFSHGWDEDTYATSHVATFKVGEDIVIGFEDANNYNSSDFDYNDFVFTIVGDFNTGIPEVEDPDPDVPSVIEPEAPQVQAYTYCFEDMDLNGGDYDFNDCVLKVTAPVDGKIKVTLAALGATYQLKAGLNGEYLFDGKELHEVFGVGRGVMVNTGQNEAEPVIVELNVGEDWNLTDDGNFWIDVIDRNMKVMIPQFTPGFAAGNAPYAIRVADDFDYPVEREAITHKYPEFVTWAKDARQAIDWYK